MLRRIRYEAWRILKSKWNFDIGMTRLFIHYQLLLLSVTPPSTPFPGVGRLTLPVADHFHIHIVNANLCGTMGLVVGQAHLLDDVISLVRRDIDLPLLPLMSQTAGAGC